MKICDQNNNLVISKEEQNKKKTTEKCTFQLALFKFTKLILCKQKFWARVYWRYRTTTTRNRECFKILQTPIIFRQWNQLYTNKKTKKKLNFFCCCIKSYLLDRLIILFEIYRQTKQISVLLIIFI